jgi:chemotaxis protein CheX
MELSVHFIFFKSHEGGPDRMDVSYINPFINSVIDTFKTMFNETVTPGKPEIKKQPFPTYDVSGIIGLSGNAQGAVVLSFPKVAALKIVSKMIETRIKVVGAEVIDGIGELTNIVTGNSKKNLTRYTLSISLPSVVIGREHVISAPGGAPTLVVPFSCSYGPFTLEVTLKSQ